MESNTTISLDHNNLSASVPRFFAEFQNLTSLSVANSGLLGRLPEEIFQMPALQTLDLSNNELLQGWFPKFPLNASLKTLSLGDTSFGGQVPESIGNLEQLTRIDLGGLSKLVSIELQGNKQSGTIPPTLFGIPSLQELDLSQNQFNGSIRDFDGLEALSLSSNNLSGLIPMSFFQNLRNLSVLDLSFNKFSIDATSFLSLPTFTKLSMASCNLTKFPHFMKNQSELINLDLSNNQIRGEIPIWTWKLTNLDYLNLSHNLLVEFQGPLKDITLNVGVLDLHGNQLRGQIPAQIGGFLSFVSLSSNNFHGSIPESICSNSLLQLLDLSNNSLSGSIPQCLFNMSVAVVLNLKRNNLSGITPDTFSKSCRLQTLNLNQNRSEGKVPKSLVNCKSLEVLDIGNNQIKGTFPCHLKNIDQLHVLVLRSNKFNGQIACPGSNSGWPMLQIFDIAANNFRGKLPLTSLGTWEAMQPSPYKHQSELSHFLFLMPSGSTRYYQDASQSHPFLGDLQELESIDLSSNGLRGEIPSQLANLNFLSVLNVSNNKLAGPIPTRTQIQSFPESSFENNAGLCGPPLKTMCGSSPGKKDNGDPLDSGSGSIINWKHLSVEIGFIFGFGIVIVSDGVHGILNASIVVLPGLSLVCLLKPESMGGELIGTEGGEAPATTGIEEQGNELKKRGTLATISVFVCVMQFLVSVVFLLLLFHLLFSFQQLYPVCFRIN
ncbi:hypothetical protein V6N11_029585 [Hibiscus sabdariffa]|uniref:Uncharacterized protein n=1 Tax=Hibiscus sabdariffa TaxID=183260 RepID=A0ABR2P739_9ROSI